MGLMGIFVDVRPYALLDVVLTPDQLKDRSTMDETLALMQKATGYDSACWLILGGIVFGIAITGLVLWKARRSKNLHQARSQDALESLAMTKDKIQQTTRARIWRFFGASVRMALARRELFGHQRIK